MFSCNEDKKSEHKLIIFHAGSLSVPFKEIAAEFEKENPDVKIYAESSGSLDAARKITDLKKECDILAVADFLVIDKLMIPDFADWNYAFASNEIVIAYTENSKKSDEINSENWYEILLQDDIFLGRSEPNADPCGYRAVFVFKLTENHLNIPNLADNLLNKNNTVIRPKEVDLLAVLETGNIDYLIIYKSVAIQHNLKFIELPDEINLSNPQFDELYNSVSIMVDGSVPGEKNEISGSAILYGFTVPNNSPNPDVALKFLEFLTNTEKGGKILIQQGMGVVNYCDSNSTNLLPESLKNKIN